MKTKNVEIKSKTLDKEGFFTGYGSVFDVKDSYGDIVKKGAFKSSIERIKKSGKKLPILWQHDVRSIIGVWDTLKEDDYGLKMEGRLLIDDVEKAKECYSLIKAGAVDGLSIGYSIKKSKWNEESNSLDLFSLDLKETSIVTFPANQQAIISEIKNSLNKGGLPSLSYFEKFLREAGFSKSQATAIASRGLRSLLGEPAEKQGISDALKILQKHNGVTK